MYGYAVKQNVDKPLVTDRSVVFDCVFPGPAAVGNHAFVTARETKDPGLASG